MVWASSVLLDQWQVSAHLLYDAPSPPSLSLLSLKSSSVQSPSPLPSHPSALPLCGWSGIMSVGEWRHGVSVCPRGSSHTLLEGKGHPVLNTTQPSSFQAPPFTPFTTIVLRLCGTALFLSLTHPLTHKERWWEQRLGGGCWVWFCVFSPHTVCFSVGLIRHMGSTCNLLSCSSSFRHHLLISQHSPSEI